MSINTARENTYNYNETINALKSMADEYEGNFSYEILCLIKDQERKIESWHRVAELNAKALTEEQYKVKVLEATIKEMAKAVSCYGCPNHDSCDHIDCCCETAFKEKAEKKIAFCVGECCKEKEPITNYDRIKNASKEELAEIFMDHEFATKADCNWGNYPGDKEDWLEWLDSEVEIE